MVKFQYVVLSVEPFGHSLRSLKGSSENPASVTIYIVGGIAHAIELMLAYSNIQERW